MLVELSAVEQRYHAVMKVTGGGVPVVEVAGGRRFSGPPNRPRGLSTVSEEVAARRSLR